MTTKKFETSEERVIERIFVCVLDTVNKIAYVKQNTKENKERIKEIYSSCDKARLVQLRGVDTVTAFENLDLIGINHEEYKLDRTRVHQPKEKAVELNIDDFFAEVETDTEEG